MSYLGSWKIDKALEFYCNTHSASTGAATDADAAPAYRVYEEGSDTALLNGTMSKLDDANTTGAYKVQITLSAANGFEVGKQYVIYISAAVGSVTGTMNSTFQIGADVNVYAVSDATAIADNLEVVYTTMTTPQHFGLITAGIAQAAASNTLTLAASFSASNDVMIGCTAFIRSSTNGIYSRRQGIDWDNTTKVLTVDAWDQTPSGTIAYAIFATAPASAASPAPVNLTQVGGSAIPTPNQSGVPIIDIGYVAGVAHNAASAQYGADLINIAGAAVATGTAQLGVNIVNISGTAAGTANLLSMFNGAGYAGGTTKLGVDVVALSGDTTAADNAETAFDGGSYNVGGGGVVAATVTGTPSINVATFTAGAITSAAFTAGAINAAAVAADVTADIFSGTALTESYATDGAAATPAQLLYMIWSFLADKSISGTTVTAKKVDGTTTSMTFTLNDATTPTSITRAT